MQTLKRGEEACDIFLKSSFCLFTWCDFLNMCCSQALERSVKPEAPESFHARCLLNCHGCSQMTGAPMLGGRTCWRECSRTRLADVSCKGRESQHFGSSVIMAQVSRCSVKVLTGATQRQERGCSSDTLLARTGSDGAWPPLLRQTRDLIRRS